MTVIRALARPLLAASFLNDGFDDVCHPESKAAAADSVLRSLSKTFGFELSAVNAVRVNGFAQLLGGALLARGVLPRLGAATLAASVVPSTLAMHRFWEEGDEQSRKVERMHFLKNAAMLGGLLLAAVDTGGAPSVAWRARRATTRVAGRLTERPGKDHK
jgi:uncharacterized membrane protein YphA (DoxX/SURF4 family)